MAPALVRTDWLRVALLFAAGLLAAAQFGKVSLTLAEVAAAYGRDVAGVSVLVSLVSVTGVLFGAVAGMIVARYGARRMLLLALLLGGALSLVQALLPPFPLLFATRLFEGVSHLTIVVAAPTAMAAAAGPKDQPVVMGIWGMFFGVSFALAALIFPRVLETGALPLLFCLHGLLMWALAGALWRTMPAVKLPRTTRRDGLLAEHLAIYTTPATLAPALVFVWHTLGFVALLTFVPPLLGWGGSLLPLMSLAGTFLAGVLARRIAPLRLAFSAFCASLPLALLIAALPGVLAPLMVPFFLLMGIIPGAAFAAIPALNATPGGRARASGAVAQLGNVGTALGTPLFALTLDHGLSGLMMMAAVLPACGALLILLIHIKLPRNA
ncbi:MFS transporter [Oceaniglobus roseus]|uniref:MFS transporter n=1 Tax=Oceaniglobus roseus TaxID=1737570 RepID=UPI000C7F22D2|nr:MFS transporter [Kandeliimicrobium roseum]